MFVEDVMHRVGFGKPDAVIKLANVERRERFALFLLGDKLDVITLGLFENEAGDFEQRVGATGQFDLARKRFDAFFFGNKIYIDGRKRRKFATFLLPPAEA